MDSIFFGTEILETLLENFTIYCFHDQVDLTHWNLQWTPLHSSLAQLCVHCQQLSKWHLNCQSVWLRLENVSLSCHLNYKLIKLYLVLVLHKNSNQTQRLGVLHWKWEQSQFKWESCCLLSSPWDCFGWKCLEEKTSTPLTDWCSATGCFPFWI